MDKFRAPYLADDVLVGKKFDWVNHMADSFQDTLYPREASDR